MTLQFIIGTGSGEHTIIQGVDFNSYSYDSAHNILQVVYIAGKKEVVSNQFTATDSVVTYEGCCIIQMYL